MKRLLIAALSVAASSGTVLAQDVEAGEASFRKCAPCHRVGEDATNMVGPVLNGLDGRKAGAVEGYSSSDANKNSGITWTEETFKEYIKDPRAKVPGTKMILLASRVRKNSPTCGVISNNSPLMAVKSRMCRYDTLVESAPGAQTAL